MTPVEFALFILKANIIIFIITIGASALAIFPYNLHLNQIMNNMALDVANRNYITDKDINKYVDHLTEPQGSAKANLYSMQTFKEYDLNSGASLRGSAAIDTFDNGSLKMGAGHIVFSDSLPHTGYTVAKQSKVILTVKLKDTTTDGSILLKGAPTDFDPLSNLSHTKQGMENGYGGGKVVQRGHTFELEIATRYKLTGAAFGFFLTAAIPTSVSTNGVTTQYYQYDAGAIFD